MSLPVLQRGEDRGILPGRLTVSYATIYRVFKQLGVSGSSSAYPDRRRFEAELPNDIGSRTACTAPGYCTRGR
jgi:hypothetical protein